MFEFLFNAVFSIYDAKQNEKIRIRQREQQALNYSLSCRKCRGLASPIPGTQNRYRCACGNQFAGAKHPL